MSTTGAPREDGSGGPPYEPPDAGPSVSTEAARQGRRVVFYVLLFCSVIGGLVVAAKVDRLDHTAAFYVGIPVLIALAFAWTVPPSKSTLGSAMKGLTALLLLSVPLLREGFLCVLFAAPILYGVTGLVAGLIDYSRSRSSTGTGRRTTEASLALGLVALMTTEGLHPALTVGRQRVVTRQAHVAATPAEIEAQLARPLDLDRPRGLFLRIFPEPVEITGYGTEAGASRALRFVYAKWIWWNEHEGTARFRIERPAQGHVRYVPAGDTSYVGTYLRWGAVDLFIAAAPDGGTDVKLVVPYERKIDPAWYFGPLQHTAVGLVADTLIENGVTPRGARK